MGGVCSGGIGKQNPSNFSEKLKAENGRKYQKRINLEPLQFPFPGEWLSMPAKTGGYPEDINTWKRRHWGPRHDWFNKLRTNGITSCKWRNGMNQEVCLRIDL